jgi:dolichyl-phosphate beta-glucosyltransferase
VTGTDGTASRPVVSVVVPAHNEAKRLPHLIRALADVAEDSWQVVIADDGSTDDTAAVAERLMAEAGLEGEIVGLPHNRGKGAALRAAMAVTNGDVVVMMDADLATDLAALPRLFDGLREHDIVVGTRCGPEAVVVADSTARRTGARVFNWIVRLATGLSVSDTQCGFKGFRGDLARKLFAASTIDRWGQDVEILDLANRMGASIVEVPVTWTAMAGSHVRVGRDAARTLVELAGHVGRRRTLLRSLARG